MEQLRGGCVRYAAEPPFQVSRYTGSPRPGSPHLTLHTGLKPFSRYMSAGGPADGGCSHERLILIAAFSSACIRLLPLGIRSRRSSRAYPAAIGLMTSQMARLNSAPHPPTHRPARPKPAPCRRLSARPRQGNSGLAFGPVLDSAPGIDIQMTFWPERNATMINGVSAPCWGT